MSSQFWNKPSDSFLARELQRHQIQMLAMEAFILRKISEQRISIDEADQIGTAFLNVIQGQAGIDTVQATPLGIAILKQANHIRRELLKQLFQNRQRKLTCWGYQSLVRRCDLRPRNLPYDSLNLHDSQVINGDVGSAGCGRASICHCPLVSLHRSSRNVNATKCFTHYLDDLYGKSEEFQQASETIQLSLLEMIAGRMRDWYSAQNGRTA